MGYLFLLFTVFQAKHYLADYMFQTEYMLGKFKKKRWFFPLLTHALVHGVITLIIMLSIAPSFWWLSILDLVTHFLIDIIRARPNLLGRFKPDDKRFWWSLGADQMFHHLIHYLIIWIVIIY